MVMVEDWRRLVAEELNGWDLCDGVEDTLQKLNAALDKHCPFRPGVPYLPVTPSENLGQELVDHINAGRWEQATILLVTRNDEIYRALKRQGE